MTDVNTTHDDDLYDDASEEFASKEDLKDRLVAVWVTGKQGQRANPDGKRYDWVETVTLVLDDGPDGDRVTALVGPAPVQLDKFQWSTAGMVSRLQPRINLRRDGELVCKPMVGRINSRNNKVKGWSASWSIAAPTDEDKEIARKHEAEIKRITAEVKELRTAAADDEAFD